MLGHYKPSDGASVLLSASGCNPVF